MKKMAIIVEVVPNPAEKGYYMYEFKHPIHGRKYLGCFKKDLDKHWKAAVSSFMLNCGLKNSNPEDYFEFWVKR